MKAVSQWGIDGVCVCVFLFDVHKRITKDFVTIWRCLPWFLSFTQRSASLTTLFFSSGKKGVKNKILFWGTFNVLQSHLG